MVLSLHRDGGVDVVPVALYRIVQMWASAAAGVAAARDKTARADRVADFYQLLIKMTVHGLITVRMAYDYAAAARFIRPYLLNGADGGAEYICADRNAKVNAPVRNAPFLYRMNSIAVWGRYARLVA